jgi:hypothetical protein
LGKKGKREGEEYERKVTSVTSRINSNQRTQCTPEISTILLRRNKMKKLVLMSMLVIGTASMAFATPVLRVDPTQVKNDYSPSDMITIQLYDSGSVIGAEIDAITDNPSGTALGTASNDAFNSNWNTTWAASLNTDGMLVEGMDACQTSIPLTPLSGVLYSFQYHVPKVPASTIITIQTLSGTCRMIT